LQVENPSVLDAANQMLKPLKLHYPDITKTEKDHPFVETATFADVIREPGQAYGWQMPWHFIDQPYINEAGKSINDFPDFKLDTVDVVDALSNLTNFLMDTGDYKQTTYYQQIKDAFPNLQD